MRARFDGAPVVAGRDHHRVDAVHNALVVRRRPVGVGGSEGPRLKYSLRDLLARVPVERQRVLRDRDLGAGQPPVGQVRQDAQPDAPARDFGDWPGEVFTRGVDHVRAHRVTHVVNQVHDQHRPGGGV